MTQQQSNDLDLNSSTVGGKMKRKRVWYVISHLQTRPRIQFPPPTITKNEGKNHFGVDCLFGMYVHSPLNHFIV